MKIVSLMIVTGCVVLGAGSRHLGGGTANPESSLQTSHTSPPTPGGLGTPASHPSSPKSGGSARAWDPAVYRGLVMGKSSRADAVAVLGKPVWTGKEEGTGVPMMGFGKVAEPVPGKLSVQLENNVVAGMILEPEDRYTKNEIVKILGPGYTTGHYAEAECLSRGDIGGPLYEDASGDLEFVEYRARGIAVSIHNGGLVGEISFVKGPLGSVRSPCPAGWSKRRSYYPLAVGNWWSYSVNDYTGTSVKTTNVKWQVDSSDGKKPPVYNVSSTPTADANASLKLLASGRVVSELKTQRTLIEDDNNDPIHAGARWSDSSQQDVFEVLSAGKPCRAGTRTFRDCAVIRERNSKTDVSVITAYARGVGPVEYRYSEGSKLVRAMSLRAWRVAPKF